MAWMIAVKGLVLIEEITFGDKAAVDVALFEINGCLSLMLNMSHFLSCPLAKGSVEDQKLALAKYHPAALKSRVSLWLAVQRPCHLGSMSACP